MLHNWKLYLFVDRIHAVLRIHYKSTNYTLSGSVQVYQKLDLIRVYRLSGQTHEQMYSRIHSILPEVN